MPDFELKQGDFEYLPAITLKNAAVVGDVQENRTTNFCGRVDKRHR